ncbi:MAG: DedA family protein [Planctomycetes bacterium]|nr:DedA family protein [Planctomycetota bacterium]
MNQSESRVPSPESGVAAGGLLARDSRRATQDIGRRNPFRRLYHWILSWAHHPWGTWALALFAFIDSSIFPIPPLFLQIALSLEKPRRAWWYAAVNTIASVLGAVAGYLIGMFLYESVGRWVIETWGYRRQFDRVGTFLDGNTFSFALVWSFLPFPYKVLTIGAGFFGASLPALLVASTIGRSLRFFAIAALLRFFGARARDFIERYFNWVLLGVAALVAAVILAMRLM